MEHNTPQQSFGAIQCILKKLDLNNMTTPAVEEIKSKSFMYLQELVFKFAKKEKEEKPTKCTYSFLIPSLDSFWL